jgi:hypothetical protein
VRTEQIQQGLFLLVAVGILVRHFVVNGFEQPADLAVLVPHDEGRPTVGHTGFLFPQREQEILFPHNVSLQTELELSECFLRLGEIGPFELLKRLEQLIQPVMVQLVEGADGCALTHDASQMNL